MKFSEYLKPALGVVFVAVVAFGSYWFELRPHPEEKDTPGQALVIVTKSTNACFSDMVRVTGFIVPRREAQIGVDQEGSRVTDLFVKEGDTVTENQELARLTAPPQIPGAPAGRPGPVSLRAPAGGLVTVGYGKSKLKDQSQPLAEVNRRVQVVNMENKSTASNTAK